MLGRSITVARLAAPIGGGGVLGGPCVGGFGGPCSFGRLPRDWAALITGTRNLRRPCSRRRAWRAGRPIGWRRFRTRTVLSGSLGTAGLGRCFRLPLGLLDAGCFQGRDRLRTGRIQAHRSRCVGHGGCPQGAGSRSRCHGRRTDRCSGCCGCWGQHGWSSLRRWVRLGESHFDDLAVAIFIGHDGL